MAIAPLYSKENPALHTVGTGSATFFGTTIESDWFAVALTAGATYQFALQGAGNGAYSGLTGTADRRVASLSLYDAQHKFIPDGYADTGAWANLPALPFTPAASGTYYLQAQGMASGGYVLHSRVTTPDDFGSSAARHGSLALGATVDATLGLANDRDWFALDLSAGTLYQFALVDKSGRAPTDMWLDLVNANGGSVAWAGQATGESRLALSGTPETTGRYYLEAFSLAAAGNYSVTASAIADDFGANVARSGRLAPGATVSGKLEAEHDRDWFEINLEAGQTYLFRTNSAAAPLEELDVYLLDPVSGATTRTREPFTAPVSGKYYLEVNAWASGPYQLTATQMAEDDFGNAAGVNAGLIVAGKTLAGTIAYTGDLDYFRMPVTAGSVYEIAYTTTGTRPYAAAGLSSTPEQVGLVEHLGNRNEGAASVSTFRALVSTELDQVSYGEAGSQYTITARLLGPDDHGDSDATATALAIGASVAGRIERIGDIDAFKIAITAGTSYVFQGSGELANSAMALSGSLMVPPKPGASFAFTASRSGEFVLYASAAAGTGSYGLTVSTTLNDLFYGSANGARFDGGAGIDTVIYSRVRADYKVERSGAGFSVSQNYSSGNDELVNVERIKFSTSAWALDIDGVGGAAYRLYRAAFDRTPDQAGVGYWIGAMDKGASLQSVAAGFVISAEFRALYGAVPTNAEFVSRLYLNVLDRPGEAAGVDFWVGVLDRGMSRGEVLAGFSGSHENVAAVATIIGNGFAYLPYA